MADASNYFNGSDVNAPWPSIEAAKYPWPRCARLIAILREERGYFKALAEGGCRFAFNNGPRAKGCECLSCWADKVDDAIGGDS